MIRNIKTIIKRALSLAMCVIISINLNATYVKAEESDFDENNDDPIIVVSLGDSYSSGEGIEPFYGQDKNTEDKVTDPDWLAHRSQESWPSKLRIQGLDGTLADHRDENWYFVAASGAVTDNLLKTQKKEYNYWGFRGAEYLEPQLEVFNELDKDTVDYVTLTFGGNDVGFQNIVKAAVIYDFTIPYVNPMGLQDDLKPTWDEFETKGGTRDSIRRAYDIISEKAGKNAKIIVAGYPTLLALNGREGWSFSEDVAKIIDENVTEFNKCIKEIVDEKRNYGMKIYFANVEERFYEHEAYSADEAWIKEIMLPQGEDLDDSMWVSAYSMHPDSAGVEAYRKAVQEVIDALESGAFEDARDTNSDSKDVQSKIEDEVDKKKKEIEDEVDKKKEEIEKKAEEQFDTGVEEFKKKLNVWLNRFLIEHCSGL